MTYFLIAMYLAAIVAANLIVSHFGPDSSVATALVLIGFNLTARDKLHDLWGKNRFRNMAILIVAGSVVSYIAAKTLGAGPPDIVARIALASCIAFAVSEGFDALVYQAVSWRPWIERASISNMVGAVLDSVVFVSIAFGWDWQIILAQAGAKFLGGFVWIMVLNKVRARRVATA